MGETAFSRILGRAKDAAIDGWNPDNPVGLDPRTWSALQRDGLFRTQQSRWNPILALNEALLGGSGALLDLAAKSGGATYGAGVGALSSKSTDA